LVCYYFVGYEIPRYDTFQLFTGFGILFLTYLLIVRKSTDESVTFWIVVSIVLRVSLLFSWPQLSDDFFRFIWDGRLWASGHHPFAAVPSEYLKLGIPGIDQELFNHLNSKDYFTVYPPVSQYVFWLAAKFSPGSVWGSVIVMRVVILLSEIATILLIKSLLKKFNFPKRNVLLYALNPLIILELTGNLHFEAMVILFLLLSVWFMSQQKSILSASAISLAACTKLVPLIFLPAFLGRMTVKKLLLYYVTIAITSLLIFLPFLDWEVINSLQSVGLYFYSFEFNASIYYLVREVGYTLYGYNIIQTVGWKLALIVFIIILFFVWIRMRQAKYKEEERPNQSFFLEWMWMLFIYLLFTTTLHPWYITALLALSIFTSYRFVILWTGLIFLTYAGYTPDSFHEVLWLTALEYGLVIVYLIYELWNRRDTLYFPWNNGNLFDR